MELTRIGKTNYEYFEDFMLSEPVKGVTALGIMDEGCAVGAGEITLEGSTCVLESLYVHPDYRRRKTGTYFLSKLVSMLSDEDFTEIICFGPGDEEILSFLRYNNFSVAHNYPIYSFALSDLLGSAEYRKLKKVGADAKNVTPFHLLSKAEKVRISRELSEQEFDASLFYEGAYDAELSFAMVSEGKTEGLILARRLEEDCDITLFWTFRDNNLAVAAVFNAFVNKLQSLPEQAENIRFVGRNADIAGTLKKLLGDPELLKEEGYIFSALRLLV